MLDEGEVCFDIGSHTCMFSLIASSRYRRVVALEPLFENAIHANIQLSSNEVENVSTRILALDAVETQKEILIRTGNMSGAKLYKIGRYSDDLDSGALMERLVNTTTLKNLKSTENVEKIDLLKMSVNGAEYAIIESLTDEDWRSIGSLSLEYTLKSPTSHKGLLKVIAGHFKRSGIVELDKRGFIWATN